MKLKILFLLISVSTIVLLMVEISLAEVKISDMPTSEKIRNFIPQSLTNLFKAFNNINLNFSKLPFFNKIAGAIPRTGEEASGIFQWLTQGLRNFNNWLKTHIGLNIIFIIKKIGELFIWIFEGIANLLKIGLSFIR